jgi:hypothetical protein
MDYSASSVAAGTCINSVASRCPEMDYSGFQTSCHNIYLSGSFSFTINTSFIIDKIGFNAICIKIREENSCRYLNWKGGKKNTTESATFESLAVGLLQCRHWSLILYESQCALSTDCTEGHWILNTSDRFWIPGRNTRATSLHCC